MLVPFSFDVFSDAKLSKLTSCPVPGFPKAVETTHDNFVSQLMLLGGGDCSDFDENAVNVRRPDLFTP